MDLYVYFQHKFLYFVLFDTSLVDKDKLRVWMGFEPGNYSVRSANV